jgi:SOS-response transcriptional repressor LexA
MPIYRMGVLFVSKKPDEWISLEVYKFIRDYIEEKGYSPTQREISKACLMSKGNLGVYLGRLEGWGWIVREYKLPRSIRFGEKAPNKEDFAKLLKAKKPKDN